MTLCNLGSWLSKHLQVSSQEGKTHREVKPLKTPASCVDQERLPGELGLEQGLQRKIQTNREDGEDISGGGNSKAKVQRRWAPGMFEGRRDCGNGKAPDLIQPWGLRLADITQRLCGFPELQFPPSWTGCYILSASSASQGRRFGPKWRKNFLTGGNGFQSPCYGQAYWEGDLWRPLPCPRFCDPTSQRCRPCFWRCPSHISLTQIFSQHLLLACSAPGTVRSITQ